jgi:hypothetical protein
MIKKNAKGFLLNPTTEKNPANEARQQKVREKISMYIENN